jgi:hypothetical protein
MAAQGRRSRSGCSRRRRRRGAEVAALPAVSTLLWIGSGLRVFGGVLVAHGEPRTVRRRHPPLFMALHDGGPSTMLGLSGPH